MIKQRLKEISKIVAPIGKLIHITTNSDFMQVRDLTTGSILDLVKSDYSALNILAKDKLSIDLTEYGGSLNEEQIDELIPENKLISMQLAQLIKDGVWAYNVNNVNLQMKIYWQEATENEDAGFYMEPLPQKIKYKNHEVARLFQLELAKK